MTTSHDPLRDLDVTMFPCNTTAIRTWSSFLSRILPLLNRSLEEAQAVTVAVVTGAIQPASHAPSDTNHTEHVFQYTYSEGDVVVQPPAREPVPLPKAVLYLLMAALVVVLVAYAIVGHLVKDLVHEFVEWVVGPRSRNRGSKTDVSCVTGNELSELPSLLETNYITHNHTDRPASSKREDLVVNLDDPVELHHHPYRVT